MTSMGIIGKITTLNRGSRLITSTDWPLGLLFFHNESSMNVLVISEVDKSALFSFVIR